MHLYFSAKWNMVDLFFKTFLRKKLKCSIFYLSSLYIRGLCIVSFPHYIVARKQNHVRIFTVTWVLSHWWVRCHSTANLLHWAFEMLSRAKNWENLHAKGYPWQPESQTHQLWATRPEWRKSDPRSHQQEFYLCLVKGLHTRTHIYIRLLNSGCYLQPFSNNPSFIPILSVKEPFILIFEN